MFTSNEGEQCDRTTLYQICMISDERIIFLITFIKIVLYHSFFHFLNKFQFISAPNYQYLVHDCFAKSKRKNVLIMDSNG